MSASGLVVSEIYGGGGSNPSSPYRNDYVVIHNTSAVAQSLNGFSIQTALGGTSSNWDVTPLSGTIQSGGYYLVQLGQFPAGSTDGAPLPTPNAVGTANIGSVTNKVALVSSQTALTGASPNRSDIVDFVGVGSEATKYEGTGPTPNGSNTTSLERLNRGTQDTDNNANDFVAGTPSPENSASPTFVCYCTGTRIRTARGEVAVEALRAGDLAVTASGTLRPITWIGHRDLGGHGRTLPFAQQPVRVRASAFGPGIPARTLRLSPGHPVLVGADEDGEGGHLVPVMCLINGTSITRETTATSVTYWHVELDAHDILLAEGLPAESYLDWGDRAFFDEASDHALHDPDFVVPGLGDRCRPVAIEGAVVEAARRQLDAVFAAELTGHSAWGNADADLWLAA